MMKIMKSSRKFCPINWIQLLNRLFEPCHVSSLALTRIVLGLLLLLDIIHERGLSRADIIWSEQMSDRCRFPLFSFLELQLTTPTIYGLYSIMVIGILGVTMGYHYRISALLYSTVYWLLFLQDKSRWNNHSYLFGLLSLNFLFNDSNRLWSLDVFLKRIPSNYHYVEQWQYFLLRFQIFLVYFYAGLKKFNPDWLLGYSMINLSQHWVFAPARLIVPSYWIDYYLIHVCGFLFDLFVGFLFIYDRTRWLAFILCSIFNLINSQLFQIGMFPWVMLAMMPIFCPPDWPITLMEKYGWCNGKPIQQQQHQQLSIARPSDCNKKILKSFLIIGYVIIQILLPFAFLVLRGFNTWTTGIYGYNWDMMVHNWNNVHIQIKIRAVNPHENQTIVKYLDSESWTHNHRWSHHADMAKQLALCVDRKLRSKYEYEQVEVFLDVWTSLNGRFAQRLFDSQVDLVRANWSPFHTPEWVNPIYPGSNYWRRRLYYHFEQFNDLIVANQINGSLTLFLAEQPGHFFQSYIQEEFSDPTQLIVFDQQLMVQIWNKNGTRKNVLVEKNGQLSLEPASLIRILANGRSNETYFALLYPKLSTKSLESNAIMANKRGNLYSLWISLKFFWIGLKFLIWDVILIKTTTILMECLTTLWCFFQI